MTLEELLVGQDGNAVCAGLIIDQSGSHGVKVFGDHAGGGRRLLDFADEPEGAGSQRLAEAALAYGKAIAINPRHSDAYNNLGNLMLVQGRVREAVEQYCKLITLIPDQPEARKLLGIAYYMLGQYEAAADVYRKWLAMEPDNPVAKHQLAACSGEHIPARASDAYVESTFDRFADSFDAKLAHLSYRAPQLIAEALAHVAGEPGKRLAVLDAGCGTGRPSSSAASIQQAMASMTFSTASCGVSPSDMQPGSSGTSASQPPPSAALSGRSVMR